MIHVQYFGLLRSVTGVREEYLKATRLKEVVQQISELHGPKAKGIARTSVITINGTNAALIRGYSTRLTEGDQVQIIPPAMGG